MWATRAKAAFIPSPLPPIGLGAVAPGRPESGGKKQRATCTRGVWAQAQRGTKFRPPCKGGANLSPPAPSLLLWAHMQDRRAASEHEKV